MAAETLLSLEHFELLSAPSCLFMTVYVVVQFSYLKDTVKVILTLAHVVNIVILNTQLSHANP